MRALQVDESGRLSVDEAIGLALANNRALRADLEVLGQARAELVQAGLLPNPMLSVSLGLPEAGGLANLTLGLTQDLAAIWLIPSRKKAANAELQQRILSLADTASELVRETRITYVTLQYLTEAIELQQENLSVLQGSMEIAQARLLAGEGSQLDVNLLQARRTEAEIELVQLRNDLGVGQRSLLRLMGVARATVQWHPTPLAFESDLTALSDDEDASVEVALSQRLDAQAARWELESSVADFQEQKLRLIQSLGIGVAGERFERRALPGRDILADTARASIAAGQLTAPEIQSRAQRREERDFEIDYILGPSLEVSLPIFDQNQAQIAKSQFRARELQQRLEETEQRVIEGVRTVHTQHRQARERAQLYRESLVPLQRANLELSESAYRAGRESILTVLLAQGELIRARLGYAGAVRDLAIANANLERQLAGKVSPDSGPLTTPPATTTRPTVGAAMSGHPD